MRLFISRLSPDCDADSVINFVRDSLSSHLGDLGYTFRKDSVSCEKLKTKFDTYASFCVTVLLEDTVRLSTFDYLLKADVWPLGVLVRKFYQQNNG
jgi:hypothetical protein